MKTANELRIGNLVSDSNFTFTVTSIESGLIKGFNYPNDLDAEYSLLAENLQGIPLTEEWLLKFGLKYSDGIFNLTDFFTACHSDVDQWHDKEGYYLFANDVEYETDVCIQYVHQLQNLYFALTGEELTIKEP